MSTQQLNTDGSDPRHHVTIIQARLRELVSHLREDVKKVDEPRAQAMFETAAEVLMGLKTAFKQYEEQREEGLKA